MDLHILNTGDTPTFEAFRPIYLSIVDDIVCSISLLARVQNWTADRGLTTFDHIAVGRHWTLQRVYFAKKAN